VRLKTLLKDVVVEKTSGSTYIKIDAITTDSRKVSKNSLFVAMKGMDSDGHKYIPDAVKAGAKAVVYQDQNFKIDACFRNITFIRVEDTRKALAILAANFYGNSHRKMVLIGVTGTNGKTTTCELTYQLLNKLNKKTGLISTVSAKLPNSVIDTGYHVTTPDALDLHRILNDMYKSGCEYVIIETTSHGLDQHRTWGLAFEVGVITNVTPEHLDYHKTFKNYLKTKAKLFDQSKKILFNKHDPALTKLLKLIPTKLGYKIVDYTKLVFPKQFTQKFPGQYNLENAALAHAIVFEHTGTDTTNYFANLESVKGRLETVETGRNFSVIIDFAHDAAALEKVLKVARKLTKKNLIVIFGCAGLRDKLKRPKMGALAVNLADKAVITAEDPRSEVLENIIKEIEAGAIKAGGVKDKDYFIVKDRQHAINFALNKLAKEGDLVLITGKGHEKSMCFGATEVPWSDQEAVKQALVK
jgi:UDP-N-acetylmuramoyl-L-alanyl-D-glutamate--2,6-diaminopimelate ligase